MRHLDAVRARVARRVHAPWAPHRALGSWPSVAKDSATWYTAGALVPGVKARAARQGIAAAAGRAAAAALGHKARLRSNLITRHFWVLRHKKLLRKTFGPAALPTLLIIICVSTRTHANTHPHKLVVVDLPVAIHIRLADHLFDLLVGELFAWVSTRPCQPEATYRGWSCCVSTLHCIVTYTWRSSAAEIYPLPSLSNTRKASLISSSPVSYTHLTLPTICSV